MPKTNSRAEFDLFSSFEGLAASVTSELSKAFTASAIYRSKTIARSSILGCNSTLLVKQHQELIDH